MDKLQSTRTFRLSIKHCSILAKLKLILGHENESDVMRDALETLDDVCMAQKLTEIGKSVHVYNEAQVRQDALIENRARQKPGTVRHGGDTVRQ